MVRRRKRLEFAAVLVLFASAAIAQENYDQKFDVPDPEGDNKVIVEFARSIEGTDGTPESIAAKLSAAAKSVPVQNPQNAALKPTLSSQPLKSQQPKPTPTPPHAQPQAKPDKQELPVMGF